MADILAENLSGKTVTGADGAEMGMLYNITMDLKSGELQNLIVDPDEGAPTDAGFETDDFGHYLVPVSRVEAVKDHIIVAR